MDLVEVCSYCPHGDKRGPSLILHRLIKENLKKSFCFKTVRSRALIFGMKYWLYKRFQNSWPLETLDILFQNILLQKAFLAVIMLAVKWQQTCNAYILTTVLTMGWKLYDIAMITKKNGLLFYSDATVSVMSGAGNRMQSLWKRTGFNYLVILLCVSLKRKNSQ